MTAYAGITVVEVSDGIAGALCGRYLADLGARVFKLELPQVDRVRSWGGAESNEAIFGYLNRGKSIVSRHNLDEHALESLAADVLLLHLDPRSRLPDTPDWTRMATSNPALVLCEISDFGGVGSLSRWTGSELILQAISGFTRYVGEPNGSPLRIGCEIAGTAGAIAAFQAVAAALLARRRNGQGARVQISTLKALMSAKSVLMAAQTKPDDWHGFHLRAPYVSPDYGWATRNGQVTFDFRHEQRREWASFCRTIGVGHVVSDPDYADWRSTIFTGDRRHDLGKVYHPFFAANDSDLVADTINRHGGISVKLQSYDELLAHPQIAAIAPFVDVEHAGGASTRQVGLPFEYSRPLAHSTFCKAIAVSAISLGADAGGGPSKPVASAMNGSAKMDNALPLAGMRVLDASVGGVGPWAGSLLGMLGAEVVKLEAPSGDFIRNILPRQDGLSTTYMALNLNKKGIVLDLKAPDGYRAALNLAASADVFIENFRPGTAERLGLGHDALSAANPRLVYVSATGFGRTGPLASFAATDPHIQAFSGLASLNGSSPGERQLWRWYGHIDVTTANVIVQAILAALWDRESSGKGILICVSMLKSALALQGIRLAEHFGGGTVVPLASGSTYLVPDQAFEALDGPIAISATDDLQWRALCDVLSASTLVDDTRYRTNQDRLANRDSLVAALEAIIKTRPASFWEARLQRAGVPCSRFLNFEVLRNHTYFRENGIIDDVRSPTGGELCVGGAPWTFSNCTARAEGGPRPGEHTELYAGGHWLSARTGAVG